VCTGCISFSSRPDVIVVNITIPSNVDIVNIWKIRWSAMARSPALPPRRRARYHHGDLRRALLEQAVRTIRTHGVERLTLRSIGARLGVSRTALYRHFADKSALLAAVAQEGFRTLRLALVEGWEKGGRQREGFEAMSVAYVRFALTHPSHYRVMFGGLIDARATAELTKEASGAFQALVDAIVAQQQAGLIRPDEPLILARFIWAVVHGVAMLALDCQLGREQANPEGLIGYAVDRIHDGIAPSRPAANTR
jgi:AcrR family transcriptional regulator